MTQAKPRAQPKPRPRREYVLYWLWRSEKHRYGVLYAASRPLEGGAWDYREFFLRPLGPTTWEVAELSEEAGVSSECVVDLAGPGCSCDRFARYDDCGHVVVLKLLKENGRL